MLIRTAILRDLILVVFCGSLAFAQGMGPHSTGATQSAPEQKPSGVASGPAYSPMKDAQSRPITAGGFVDGAPIVYEDATARSGLKSFQHVSGDADKKFILEAPGSGVALLDYDGDGWLDVYLVNGSTFGALRGKEPAPHAA